MAAIILTRKTLSCRKRAPIEKREINQTIGVMQETIKNILCHIENIMDCYLTAYYVEKKPF